MLLKVIKICDRRNVTPVGRNKKCRDMTKMSAEIWPNKNNKTSRNFPKFSIPTIHWLVIIAKCVWRRTDRTKRCQRYFNTGHRIASDMRFWIFKDKQTKSKHTCVLSEFFFSILCKTIFGFVPKVRFFSFYHFIMTCL